MVGGGIQGVQSHFSSHRGKLELRAHTEKVHSVDWSVDGRRLGSGSLDRTVVITSVESDRLVRNHIFRGHQDSVDQLCWHRTQPDQLATASGDKTVRLWDTRVQKVSSIISTKGENINMTWSKDGHTIAVGNKEDLISFIDVRTAKVKKEEAFKFEVNEISWNNTGDLFYLTSGQGCIYVLSYPELEQQHCIQAHPGNCICLKFDPLGRYFATGSADALVSLWDVQELACVRTFSRLEWPVRTLSFSYDGQLLASASEDLLIDISWIDSGERVAEVPVEAPTFTVAWHPKQYLLAFACDDKDKCMPMDRGERDAGLLKVYGFSSSTK